MNVHPPSRVAPDGAGRATGRGARIWEAGARKASENPQVGSDWCVTLPCSRGGGAFRRKCCYPNAGKLHTTAGLTWAGTFAKLHLGDRAGQFAESNQWQAHGRVTEHW